jgi:hypothetical protein
MKAEQTKEIDTKQNRMSAVLTKELCISSVLSYISRAMNLILLSPGNDSPQKRRIYSCLLGVVNLYCPSLAAGFDFCGQ